MNVKCTYKDCNKISLKYHGLSPLCLEHYNKIVEPNSPETSSSLFEGELVQTCSKCESIKVLDKFGKSHKAKSGYKKICKECVSKAIQHTRQMNASIRTSK